jgi:hypothetical protein
MSRPIVEAHLGTYGIYLRCFQLIAHLCLKLFQIEAIRHRGMIPNGLAVTVHSLLTAFYAHNFIGNLIVIIIMTRR